MKIINKYLETLKIVVGMLNSAHIKQVAGVLHNAIKKQHPIYSFGNGGSASTASHLAVDFSKMLNADVTCLADNIPTITAIANDICYEDIFIKQLKYKNIKSDAVLMAFSGSGNSENVCRVFENYKDLKNKIAIVGYDGGDLKKLADYCIHVPVSDMQITEDLHLSIVHILTRELICKI